MRSFPDAAFSPRARLAAALAVSCLSSLSPAQCLPAWSGVKRGSDWHTLALGVADGLSHDPGGLLMTGGGFFGMAGQWSPRLTFSDGGTFDNPYGSVPLTLATLVFECAAVPGGGAIIAGDFPLIGGVQARNIARLDMEGYHALGEGLAARVYAVNFFAPSGAEVTLHSAGGFGVATWNGHAWTTLPTPSSWGNVLALQVFDDDGKGPRVPALYVGGAFGDNPGDLIRKIGRWDGTSWEPVGSPLIQFGTVDALAVWDDDGPGPHPDSLYVGGYYRITGTTLSATLMRLDENQNWVRPGERLNSTVHSMAVFDADGGGPEPESLFVGGLFTHAGQMEVSRIARWDGHQWHALGLPGPVGVRGFGGGTGVDALTVFDEDGPGPNPGGLYIGGLFYYGGTEYSWHIARWGCPQAPERQPCYPDCDNDGALTLADFGCMTTNHAIRTPYADCDANGQWDLADFQCFQSQFALGCP